MGGYFSTRWGAERSRHETGSLLYLDIADLRRLGALTPGVIASVQWTDGRGDATGSIVTHMHPTSDALTLRYSVRTSDDDDWQPIGERIDLEATPCHYGGSRLWLICPACQSRRRLLYCLGGRFRCRQCHDLAYSSTREDVLERSQRRTHKLQRRLGETSSGILDVPPKPRGMHWNTYARIAHQLIGESQRQLRMLEGDYEKVEKRIARLIG
jgi:hypothetical protein